MGDRQTKLSIVVRTVDEATAKIKAINDHLDRVTKPTRDFKKALSDLGEKSGLNDVVSGFKGVGSAIGDLLGKVAMIGGIAGAAVGALFHIADGFDDLGDKAEAMNVSVDWLAQTRAAAEETGGSVDALDKGMQGFVVNLGLARANTGKLAAFMKSTGNPALLEQLKAAKGNEEAFDLVADAMSKLTDPAKKAAAAQKIFGDASLAPLLSKGSKGIKELKDEYLKNAGSMEEAAKKAGELDAAKKKLHASVDGVKAALVTGFAPALTNIVERLAEWFTAHRADIEVWAKQIGEKLPGAIQAVVEWLGKAWDKVTSFIDAIGGLKTIAIAAGAALVAGPVVALAKLGESLVTTVSRISSMSGAFAAAGGGAGSFASKLTGLLGPIGLTIAAAEVLNELTGGSIGEGQGGMFGVAERALALERLERQGRTELTDVVFKARDLEAHRAGVQSDARDALEGLPGTRGDVGAQARAALGGYRARQSESFASAMASQPPGKSKITIDVNGPPGLRAKIDPQSTDDIALKTGVQMLTAGY